MWVVLMLMMLVMMVVMMRRSQGGVVVVVSLYNWTGTRAGGLLRGQKQRCSRG
jgi:uncharacterized membrane protein